MRHLPKPLFLSSIAIVGALVLALTGASGRVQAAAQAAQGAAPARKKVLFLTYPGVGAPGSHGHASLPPAEKMSVEWGKAAGFDVTTLKGYEPGVGKQDLSFFTPAYLNQFDGLMMMANGDIGMTPVQKKAIVDFLSRNLRRRSHLKSNCRRRLQRRRVPPTPPCASATGLGSQLSERHRVRVLSPLRGVPGD